MPVKKLTNSLAPLNMNMRISNLKVERPSDEKKKKKKNCIEICPNKNKTIETLKYVVQTKMKKLVK